MESCNVHVKLPKNIVATILNENVKTTLLKLLVTYFANLDIAVRANNRVSLQERTIIIINKLEACLWPRKLKLSNGRYINAFSFFFFSCFCLFFFFYISRRTWEIPCLQFQIRPLQTKNNFLPSLFFFHSVSCLSSHWGFFNCTYSN